ncbi:MAG: hypothetical protein AAGF95_22030 [Chloroflexota bacterium]
MTRHSDWLLEAGWLGWMAVGIIIVSAFIVQWLIKHQRQLSPLVPTGVISLVFAVSLLLVHFDPNIFHVQVATLPIYIGAWALFTGGSYMYVRRKMR